MDLKGIENVQLLVWFVVPGLVAMYVRAQFLTGRMPVQTEAILPCLSLSLVCFAIGQPVQHYLLPAKESQWYLFGTLVVIFAVPALLGVLLGLSAQRGWGRRFLQTIGVTVVHQVPSAWDWKFSNTSYGAWVLVVLKDGTQFAGFFGSDSFASTDGNERDVYIQQVWDIDRDQKWTPRDSGVLILSTEIRTIEFWTIKPEEAPDDRQATA